MSIEPPSSNGAEETCAADFVLYPDCRLDPEAFAIGREEFTEFIGTWKGLLSGLEAEILGHYLERLSYREIAAIVCESPKSVDNAVQRARKKLANLLAIAGNPAEHILAPCLKSVEPFKTSVRTSTGKTESK
ncbi:MAG: hypothetical protein LBK75_03290 [Oscillospiraceae bacterium]|jgi:RNA polymerase sporulation-specific sigma factor|nr:hypothetical protein [Oscillospiraceae bacterium]